MRLMTQADKAKLFLELHRSEHPLVLPNAWDVASARIFEEAGFPAIATTSAGIANALGYADGERISRAEMLDMVARIAKAVRVPVTADMEAGYGDAAETAHGVIAAGAVGFNLEDKNDETAQCAAIRRARQACVEHGIALVINARIDLHLHGAEEPDSSAVAIQRLHAYAQAGADCLFAPGVQDEPTIEKLTRALDHPLNILATAGSPPIARLGELGVARVSVGSGPMRAVMGLTQRIARELRDSASTRLITDGAMSYVDANSLFL